MKRLLFAFALLFSIPFSSSCIKEITYPVEITGSNCTWEKPKQAIRGRTYTIKITPNEGYELYVQEGVLEVENEIHILTIYGDDLYNIETSELTIPGEHVISKLTIKANAQEKVG